MVVLRVEGTTAVVVVTLLELDPTVGVVGVFETVVLVVTAFEGVVTVVVVTVVLVLGVVVVAFVFVVVVDGVFAEVVVAGVVVAVVEAFEGVAGAGAGGAGAFAVAAAGAGAVVAGAFTAVVLLVAYPVSIDLETENIIKARTKPTKIHTNISLPLFFIYYKLVKTI